MAPKVDNDKGLKAMRVVLGSGPSDMDLIRCLHLARNDISRAINILFDTPGFNTVESTKKHREVISAVSEHNTHSQFTQLDMQSLNQTEGTNSDGAEHIISVGETCAVSDFSKRGDLIPCSSSNGDTSAALLSEWKGSNSDVNAADNAYSNNFESSSKHRNLEIDDWLYLGETDVVGFSTCKGLSVKRGETVLFTFPKIVNHNPKSVARGRGRSLVSNLEIVRFSSTNLIEVQKLHHCSTLYVTRDCWQINGICTYLFGRLVVFHLTGQSVWYPWYHKIKLRWKAHVEMHQRFFLLLTT